MSTGCARCDLNNRPMLTRGGSMGDQFDDLHRALHDLFRAACADLGHFMIVLTRR